MTAKPDSIPLMGDTVKVSFRKKIPGGHKGLCESDIKKITLQEGDTWEEISLHESMHYLLNKSGLAEMFNEEQTEAICVLTERLNSAYMLRSGVRSTSRKD